MNKKLEDKLTARLRPIIESVLREQDAWSGNDTKIADAMVQAMSKVPYPKHSTNDKAIHEMFDRVSDTRRELMRLIEEKSGLKYQPTSGNTWKLRKG